MRCVGTFSLLQIFRYTFFAVKEASGNNAPYILLWLRSEFSLWLSTYSVRGRGQDLPTGQAPALWLR